MTASTASLSQPNMNKESDSSQPGLIHYTDPKAEIQLGNILMVSTYTFSDDILRQTPISIAPAIAKIIAREKLKPLALQTAIADYCGLDCLPSDVLGPTYWASGLEVIHKIEMLTEKYIYELYVEAWLVNHYYGDRDVTSQNQVLLLLKKWYVSESAFDELTFEDLLKLALDWHKKDKMDVHKYLEMIMHATGIFRNQDFRVSVTGGKGMLGNRKSVGWLATEREDDYTRFLRSSRALRRFKEGLVGLRKPIVEVEAIT